MADFNRQLAIAVYATLSGDTAITNLVSGIYSYTPQDTDYPYIILEDIAGRDQSTMGLDGAVATVSISTWSRYTGIDEVSAIMDAVYNAMHKTSFSITGLDLATAMFASSGIIRDPDGKTWHGVQRFDVTMME